MLCRCMPVIGLQLFLLLSVLLFINVRNTESLEKDAHLYDNYIRVKRQGSSKVRSPNAPSHSREVRNEKQESECENDEQWIPPGLRKKGGIPPGQQKKNKGPCRNKIPPGHKKRQWPPPIDESNRDFKYPSLVSTPEPENNNNNNNNVIAHLENNVPVILLRPEDIRK